MSEVIYAPDPIPIHKHPSVFLAGGIQQCDDWQNIICDELMNCRGVIYNPRRSQFKALSEEMLWEQISWEFHAIEQADFFAMWFCDSPSPQPICMYELGRALALKDHDTIMIGAAEGYSRRKDLEIQTSLAIGGRPVIERHLGDLLVSIRRALTEAL